MSKTSNYDLELCDDSSKTFLDWRKSINGAENSNMKKIDSALASKANLSTSISASLFASQWTGDSAPYTQSLNISGMTSECNGMISLSSSATLDQRNSARDAMLSISSQEDGILIISADGDKPTIDIPVVIVLLG